MKEQLISKGGVGKGRPRSRSISGGTMGALTRFPKNTPQIAKKVFK